MDARLFGECLRLYESTQSVFRKGLHQLIFVDRARCHLNMDYIVDAFGRGFVFVYLPANTTSVLQPLDQTPFARFKQVFHKKMLENSFWVKGLEDQRTAVMSAIKRVLEEVFTPQVIKLGWKQTNLFPFDKKALILAVKRHVNQGVRANDPKDPVGRQVKSIVSVLRKDLRETKNATLSDSSTVRISGKNEGMLDGVYTAEEWIAKQSKVNKRKAGENLAKSQAKAAKKMHRHATKTKEAARVQFNRLKTAFSKRLDEEDDIVNLMKNSCQACGKKWVNAGSNWTVCEKCEVYSQCGICSGCPPLRQQMRFHERKCAQIYRLSNDNRNFFHQNRKRTAAVDTSLGAESNEKPVKKRITRKDQISSNKD